jgi:hypothetical protein
MKSYAKLLYTVLIVLIFSIITTSCKKKTPPTPTPPTPTPVTNQFSITAFGITTQGVQYTITNPTTGPLQITGACGDSASSNHQTVVITINNAVNAAETFTLSSSNTGVYTTGTNTSRYTTNTSNTGSINITKVDMANRLMSASYSFVAQQYYPSMGSSGTISGSFTNVGF